MIAYVQCWIFARISLNIVDSYDEPIRDPEPIN